MPAEVTNTGNLRSEGKIQPFGTSFITDGPKEVGGLNEQPSPIEYLEAALASCVLTVVSIKAKKLGLDLKGTTVKVDKTLSPSHQILKLAITLECPVAIDEKNTAELEKAAAHCPVHMAMNPSIEQSFKFVWKK